MSDVDTPRPLAVGCSALFAFGSWQRLFLGFIGFWFLLGLKFIFLSARIIGIPNVLNYIVEMGDILSNQKSGKGVARRSIGLVCGNGSDDLDTISPVGVGNWPAADTIDGDPINQISLPVILSGRDVSVEETQSPRLDGGEAHPSDLASDANLPLTWEEGYKLFWQWKIALLKKYDGRISFPISKDDPLPFLQKRTLP